MWPQFLQQQNVGEGHTVGASISPTPTTYHLPSPRPLPERKGTGSWSMGASLRLAGLGGFTDLPLPFDPTGQARLPRKHQAGSQIAKIHGDTQTLCQPPGIQAKNSNARTKHGLLS